jgi:hypothetical protein
MKINAGNTIISKVDIWEVRRKDTTMGVNSEYIKKDKKTENSRPSNMPWG